MSRRIAGKKSVQHVVDLRAELAAVVRGEVDTSDRALEHASRDASMFYVRPEAVFSPLDADDVCEVVKFASREAKKGRHISLTARSAGTDMGGGPLNDSIIVNMTAHMAECLEIGKDYAVVEPGMYYRDFDRLTEAKGLQLPSYTASREICTVGGMAANDSGGEKNVKYGKTSRYVRALEVVMADGKTHVLRDLKGVALKKKLAERSYEGLVYRAMASLVKKNKALIEKAKPHVPKNSSGYALWDIGDGVKSLNLARLMSGAQGTLGIITQITYSLITPLPYSSMAVIMLHSLDSLGALVDEALRANPDSCEVYDDHTFALGLKYFPELAGQMKLGLLGLGVSYVPELWMMATRGVPKLVFMVEFCGDTQSAALAKANAFAAMSREKFPEAAVRVAANAKAEQKYWVVRRESFNLLRKKIRGKRTAPFIDDFVVPPEKLGGFLPKLYAILDRYDLVYTIAGHAIDGNLHIIPLVDPHRPDLSQIVKDLGSEVYTLVLAEGGSITGEHNDGLVRTPYIPQMFGAKMAALFQQTKDIFDPDAIFNPGKKVGTTLAQALSHLDASAPEKA